MADQDLRINIETLADLTGIKLTQQQLDALQSAAKQGNIEAIEALKKLSQAQKDAVEAQKEAGASSKEQSEELTRGFRAAAGYALLVGGTVSKAINDIADKENKVTRELDKQFESLVKNVQQWNKLAEAATTPEQLASAGEKALSQIAEIQSKVKDASEDNRTVWQKTVDEIVKGFTSGFAPGIFKGPFEAAEEERRKGLQKVLELTEEDAARIQKRRLDEQRETHEDIDAVIERENAVLREQQALLRNVDPKTNLTDWISIEQTVERHQKRLEALKVQREKQVKAGQPTTEAGLLGQQQQKLEALLASGKLTPVEREAVFQQLVKTREEKFQKDIADREKQFQKDIAERDKRFTTPPAAAPPGESTVTTNEKLIGMLQTLIDLWR